MRRRDVLKSVGGTVVGISAVGISGAKSDLRWVRNVNDEQGDIQIVGLESLDKKQARIVTNIVRSDSEVTMSTKPVTSKGWRPDWSSPKVNRFYFEGESVSGHFDVVVVEFQKAAGGGRYGLENEEVILHWVGNTRLKTSREAESNIDPKSVLKRIAGDQRAGGATVLHAKESSDSSTKYDTLVRYRVIEEIDPVTDQEIASVPNNIEVDADSVAIRNNSSTLEKITIQANKRFNVGSREVYNCGGRGSVEPNCGGGGDDEYCEINISIYEDDSGCWNLGCLTSLLISVPLAAYGCILSGGLLCLFGFVGAEVSLADCIGCQRLDRTTEVVDRDWLDDKVDPADGSHPCEFFSTDDNTHMSVTVSEYSDIPTK